MQTRPAEDITIEDLVGYAQSLSKKLAASFIGESEAAITSYERTTRSTLPEFYRGYLKRMGRCDGRIFSSQEIRPQIATLQKFFIEEILESEDQIPPDCILIGLGAAAVEQVWMETTAAHAVYEGSGGVRMNLWSESFRKLLFRNVYMQHRHLHFPNTRVYSTFPAAGLLDRALSVIETIKAQSLWFSDRVCICAENSQVSLVLQQIQPVQGTGGLFIRISCQVSGNIDKAVLLLNEQLRVALHRVG